MFEDIAAQLEKCKQAFDKAGHSNTELHKAMNLHLQNLKLLASPLEEIKSALPNPGQSLSKRLPSLPWRLNHLSPSAISATCYLLSLLFDQVMRSEA